MSTPDRPADQESSKPVTADNPITSAADDELGRVEIAERFARQLLRLDASEGLVAGVLGPWGSGKTSFMNLSLPHLSPHADAVLTFNPWMFSGAEQLLSSFFVELSAQLRLKPDLKEIGESLEAYGEAFSGMGWLPVVGPWIERVRGGSKILATALQNRRDGTTGRREQLEQALRDLDQPIIVMVDDIDRLTSTEIRDVFKLVRLTASFPNLIYVVAFDRIRVEQALTDDGVPGREYLEKILQVAAELPPVPERILDAQLFQALDGIIQIHDVMPLDNSVWVDLYPEVVRPLVRNMRDVRRYAAALDFALDGIGNEIALADVLVLEAVRTFLPATARQISATVQGLTTLSPQTLGTSEPGHLKAEVEALILVDPDHSQEVRSLITRLFPAGARHLGGTNYDESYASMWLRNRRVAHPRWLHYYLQQTSTPQTRTWARAELAYRHLDSATDLEAVFAGIEPNELEAVLVDLEVFSEDYESRHVVPGVTTILNLLPRVPDLPRTIYTFDKTLQLRRVVLRLLRSEDGPDAVAEACDQILPSVKTLTAQLLLIELVGHHEGIGHSLVAEDVALGMEAEWRDQVRAARPQDLAIEPDLARVLFVLKRRSSEGGPQYAPPTDAAVVTAAFSGAMAESLSQELTTRHVNRSKTLHWDVLGEILGGEDSIAAALSEVRASLPNDLVELVERYLDGWRPD